MTKKPQTSKDAAEKVVKNIRRKTRQTYSAEEKIRIVLAGYLRVPLLSRSVR
jgi:transposase